MCDLCDIRVQSRCLIIFNDDDSLSNLKISVKKNIEFKNMTFRSIIIII